MAGVASGSTVLLFIEHKGSDGPTSVGTITSLAMNTDSSLTNTKLVLGARNGMRRGRHLVVVMEVEITKVVDGGNNQPMVFLISLPS